MPGKGTPVENNIETNVITIRHLRFSLNDPCMQAFAFNLLNYVLKCSHVNLY